jgi:hypothetical protein
VIRGTPEMLDRPEIEAARDIPETTATREIRVARETLENRAARETRGIGAGKVTTHLVLQGSIAILTARREE